MSVKAGRETARMAKYLFGEMTFGEYWEEAKSQGRERIVHFEVLDESPEAERRVYEVCEVEERAEHLLVRNSDPNHFVLAATLSWDYKVKPTSHGLIVEDAGVRVAIRFYSDVDWGLPPSTPQPSSCSP